MYKKEIQSEIKFNELFLKNTNFTLMFYVQLF